MFRKNKATFLVLLVSLSFQVIYCQDLKSNDPRLNEPNFDIPEYIQPCSRNDPKLDMCMTKTLNYLRPYLVNGIPELQLESIEPLMIPELGIENGQGAVRVSAHFTNITCAGASNYNVTRARVDLSNLRFDIHLHIPKIELQGRYQVEGNILLFPIQSEGDFWSRFGDVAAIVRAQGEVEIRKGVRYMRVTKLLIDFSLGRARLRVSDESNADNFIGQVMNQFLNENVNEIIEEMKPAASSSISKYFISFVNNAFTKIPLKVWLLDA